MAVGPVDLPDMTIASHGGSANADNVDSPVVDFTTDGVPAGGVLPKVESPPVTVEVPSCVTVQQNQTKYLPNKHRTVIPPKKRSH